MADISTALPDIDLEGGSTLTVDVGGAGAVITQLVIHGYQDDTGAADQEPPVGPYMLVPGPES